MKEYKFYFPETNEEAHFYNKSFDFSIDYSEYSKAFLNIFKAHDFVPIPAQNENDLLAFMSNANGVIVVLREKGVFK